MPGTSSTHAQLASLYQRFNPRNESAADACRLRGTELRLKRHDACFTNLQARAVHIAQAKAKVREMFLDDCRGVMGKFDTKNADEIWNSVIRDGQEITLGKVKALRDRVTAAGMRDKADQNQVAETDFIRTKLDDTVRGQILPRGSARPGAAAIRPQDAAPAASPSVSLPSSSKGATIPASTIDPSAEYPAQIHMPGVNSRLSVAGLIEKLEGDGSLYRSVNFDNVQSLSTRLAAVVNHADEHYPQLMNLTLRQDIHPHWKFVLELIKTSAHDKLTPAEILNLAAARASGKG